MNDKEMLIMMLLMMKFDPIILKLDRCKIGNSASLTSDFLKMLVNTKKHGYEINALEVFLTKMEKLNFYES